MSDGSYTTHVDVHHLSPGQRQQLEGKLRAEGITATWAGDRLQFDRAFEARVESLVAEAGPGAGFSAAPPGPPPVYPSQPVGVPAPYAAPGYGMGGYPPAPYAPGYPGYYAAPTTNSNAIIALVLGIGSWAVCGLCCIPAIILGRKAEREIEESQGTQTGLGLAKAGWIIGAAYAGLVVVGFLVFMVLLVIGALASN